MSVQEEINRINQNIANTYSALEEMGATLPQEQNSANMANAVRTIPQGGGGDTENDSYNVNAVGRLSVDFERFIITIVAIQNVDKTVEEIIAASHAGKTVYLHVDVSESYKENAGIPPEFELVGIAHFPLVYSSSAPEALFCAMNDFTGNGYPIITRIGGDSNNNWSCTSVPILTER